jgi:glycerate 2-kinase
VKIVLAPDSYKGSLTAKQACDAMEEGIRRIVPTAEIVKVPMADGGEGTVQSLIDATGGLIFNHEVSNPLGDLRSMPNLELWGMAQRRLLKWQKPQDYF